MRAARQAPAAAHSWWRRPPGSSRNVRATRIVGVRDHGPPGRRGLNVSGRDEAASKPSATRRKGGTSPAIAYSRRAVGDLRTQARATPGRPRPRPASEPFSPRHRWRTASTPRSRRRRPSAHATQACAPRRAAANTNRRDQVCGRRGENRRPKAARPAGGPSASSASTRSAFHATAFSHKTTAAALAVVAATNVS